MTSAQPQILVIEDDARLRRFLNITLTHHQYRLVEAATGQEGIAQAAAHMPDLIVLDLGLPDMDGVELIREIRGWSEVPILVLSARDQERDKVAALDSGADDYLTKPFGNAELLARLRVALRHKARVQAGDSEPLFRLGDLEVDFAAHLVKLGGREVHLTPIEFKLLAVLVSHAGKVITHAQLLRKVWGPNAELENQYLRVYMNQLRRKLETEPARPRYLLTEPGVGYRLRMEDG